jgi:hypothetical protein
MGKGGFVMKGNKKVVLGSDLRSEAVAFNPSAGEIIFRGDVFYGESEFRNIALLRLIIDMDDDAVFVYDEYASSYFIPYLKPIASFRTFMDCELKKLANHKHPVIRAGIKNYIRELATFSDKKSLIRQAKSCVNTLRPEKEGAESVARKVIEAMDKIPDTDVKFEKRHPELRDGEVFIGNIVPEDVAEMGWETLRVGKTAYDVCGKPINEARRPVVVMYPAFVSKEEAERKRRARCQ